MPKEIYLALIKGLKDQPIIAAFVGIVFMFTVGIGTGKVISVFNHESEQSLTVYAYTFLGSLLIYFLLAIWLTRTPPTPPVPPQTPTPPYNTDPYIDALRKAIEQLNKVKDAQWIKSDLTFGLTLKPTDDNLTTARLQMKASFRIKNLTDSSIDFPFITEIEADQSADRIIRGRLSVCSAITLNRIFDGEIKLVQLGTTAVRRYKHPPIALGPRSEWLFEWTLESYPVALPYSEYWTSAHPVLNMSIAVDVTGPKLKASAVVYRPAEEGFNQEPDLESDTFLWKSAGIFLPYQGIYLKAFR